MNLMAAGDGNRVWFPEMIETLRSQWNVAMPFPVLIELCNILATILSLGRFGIASTEVTNRTEKEWARYRAENRLDLYGRRATSTAERVGKEPICAHATPEE